MSTNPLAEQNCRAPFLGWADMVEIERALLLVEPKTEKTARALHQIKEEMDRGERAGVFSDKDRGRPHPAPLRRYGQAGAIRATGGKR